LAIRPRKGKQGGLRELAAHALRRPGALRLSGLPGSARAVVAAELVRAHGPGPVLVLGPSAKACDALLDDLRVALGEPVDDGRLAVYPRHDTLPYDRFSPQPFAVAQRMSVLYRWLACEGRGVSDEAPIVVAPWTALALRVPSRASLRRHSVELEVAGSVDRDALVEQLVAAGYARMSLVEEPGELAVRGGIVDLFPPHLRHPVRIELFGDEIESIRSFEATSQRSLAALPRVVVPPPREVLFDREQVIERGDALRELGLEHDVPDRVVDQWVDALLRGSLPPGGEAIAPVLCPDAETVFDYLPDDALVLVDEPDPGRERLEAHVEEARHAFEVAIANERLAAPPETLMLDAAAVESAIDARRPVSLERLDLGDPERDPPDTERLALGARGHEGLRAELARTRTHDRALNPLVDVLAEWIREQRRIVLACTVLSAAERLRALLGDYGIEARLANDPRPCWRWSAPGRVEVRVATLHEGFELPLEGLVVVTEEEIFGPRRKRHRRVSWEEGAALDGIAQLAPGDYLVHAEHGIGRYRGLVELELNRVPSELLAIEYLGGDRLFLPVDRLNLVQRYGGADGVTPRIDRLGGQTWEKARARVKKSLRDMAKELLSIQAAREIAPGFGFSPRDVYFDEFEASFPYEETPDQLGAIQDVLDDMQKPKPMDRLVCGDVGYGKTEVAIRAAFRAALDGKQVAVLVPTTVLCQQHEESFKERLEGYPITVDSLSRFRSPAESRKVRERLLSGEIDVVVGTHRLLQKSIRFRDLGLLVVDEEHRFGVAHKERIKRLRQTVDVLTLTATPIPRTLQLAFSGVRDLSVINTPPSDRYAVRTQVTRHSESLVREAILRELARGGQVFFVHNRVQTLHSVAEMLERIVPEAKVLTAHGQMKVHDLEDRMHAFMRGEADVLLCTTIIESGIDIPRANTILINRAHMLGLAQLYQLRGRVGRSHHRAYAYLLVPPEDALNDEARKRLEAIQDLSELGSGFRLANMDLEIRGAGNLLGAEQSGNLAAVGYETYMEMLGETIEELKGQGKSVEVDPEIRLPVPARLPEEYVPDVNQRLVLYKQLASSRENDDVDRIRDEILDRYGPLPTDAEGLLEVIRLKVAARKLGVAGLTLAKGELVFTVAESTRIDPHRLVQLLSEADSRLRVSPDHRIYAPAPPTAAGPAALFDSAHEVLSELGA